MNDLQFCIFYLYVLPLILFNCWRPIVISCVRGTVELNFNLSLSIMRQNITEEMFRLHTLSGCIGKVVASHAEGCKVARSNLAVAELHRFILCTRRSGGTEHEGGGCDQSIRSIVSDAIVHSWLWQTATRSSPFGYFSRLLQVVDNRPHILW